MATSETIAWYRKYRPSTIDDYIGENIKAIVNSRFTVPENRPQVIMISGTRGCGKTTFARIISKYYLCENQVDGKPCEQCEMCQSINNTLIAGETGVETEGVVEIDATVANGKDAIQSIIEDAIVPPLYSKYKVLIVDECHMITQQAQNSLLKIIEDIPPHLIIIFATTDIDKVLDTIKSRCQVKLEVRKKTVDEMAERLLYISEQEGLTTSMEALRIVAKKADRVPREAINLLENIAKNYGNKVTIENVRASTGDVASQVYMDFFKAANTGLEDILLFNKKLKELDINAKMFMSGLTRFTLDCLYIRHAISLEDYPIEYVQQVKELFNLYTSSEFDALLQVIEAASKSIDDDDNKSELTITTTAMRIGKIGLIAKGLATEQFKAEKENKQSIAEYRKASEEDTKKQIERAQSFSPSKEAFSNIIKSMTDVAGGEKIGPIETVDTKNDTQNNEFFSTDELDNLMGQ